MTMPDRNGLQRIMPALPVTAMKTYRALSPSAELPPTVASCERAGCGPYRSGWVTTVDESTDLGKSQAHFIRTQSGRKFTERRREDGLTEFAFEAGQRCFGRHRVPMEGAERFLVQPGDWRGTTGPVREHTSAQFWVEDFAEHQDKISSAFQRG